MRMKNILELNRVSKAYQKSGFALDNISFSLPYGSVMGFVGENGAGKTTTIGCILNTLRRDSGTVSIFGKEMLDDDVEIRERIGVVYDGDNFPGYLTVEQLAGIMQGLYRNWDQSLFQKYLKDFHLPAGQKIKNYSRGMTMQLAISAALSHHPQLLILDEATSGLDPVMRDEILDLFLGFVHVETVVLLSHKKPDSYIHIDVEFGEGEGKISVDKIVQRAEKYKPKERVTYKRIKEYVLEKYGFKVHTAYIAEVKRSLGLPMYDAPNAVEELKQPRKHPTPEKVEAIKDALHYFAVI